MAISAVSATTLREAPPPRRQRLLEDERIAVSLRLPTGAGSSPLRPL